MTVRPGRLGVRRIIAVGGLATLILGAALFHEITDDSAEGPDRTTALPVSTSLSEPPDGLPQEGPGISEPGVLVVVEPLPNGNLVVKEWVVRTAPSEGIALEVPDLTSAGSIFAGRDLSVTKVRVTGENGEVPLTNDTLDGSVVLPVGEPLQAYDLSCELDGATVISEPSSRGERWPHSPRSRTTSPTSPSSSPRRPLRYATSPAPLLRSLRSPAPRARLPPCAPASPFRGQKPWSCSNSTCRPDSA